jgi:hypothetical protein
MWPISKDWVQYPLRSGNSLGGKLGNMAP